MRKYIACFLCLILLSSLPLMVLAQTLPAVVDHAGLLSSSDAAALEEKAQSVSQEYGMDVVILTLDSLNGKSAQNYADDYYDSMGYGNDGVLFLLAMDEREWYISTCGNAIYALTDYGIEQLGSEVVPYLSSGDYAGAFDAYLEYLPHYFAAYQNGSPIDGQADYSGDYYHGEREDVVYYKESQGPNYLISVGVGLAVAAITILIMRSTMNSKHPQRSAASYLKTGSYHLRTHQDLFLYSNVSKVRRQQENSGGSSVHTGSSGRSHGGGGGRF